MKVLRVKDLIEKLQECHEQDRVYMRMKDGTMLEVQGINTTVAGGIEFYF